MKTILSLFALLLGMVTLAAQPKYVGKFYGDGGGISNVVGSSGIPTLNGKGTNTQFYTSGTGKLMANFQTGALKDINGEASLDIASRWLYGLDLTTCLDYGNRQLINTNGDVVFWWGVATNGTSGQVLMSIGDGRYYWGTPASGGTSNANFYITYSTNQYMYVSNAFITNITAVDMWTSNAYITNAYVTNITAITMVSSNAYFTNAYITNITANKVYVTEVYGATNNFGTVYITNGIAFATNSWAGPTNSVNMGVSDQYYASYTPCQITNYTGALAGHSLVVVLTITNKAATNITLYIPSTTTTPDSLRQYTISSGAVGVCSLRNTPVWGGFYNAVFREFK